MWHSFGYLLFVDVGSHAGVLEAACTLKPYSQCKYPREESTLAVNAMKA
jgi:hypothetical protein